MTRLVWLLRGAYAVSLVAFAGFPAYRWMIGDVAIALIAVGVLGMGLSGFGMFVFAAVRRTRENALALLGAVTVTALATSLWPVVGRVGEGLWFDGVAAEMDALEADLRGTALRSLHLEWNGDVINGTAVEREGVPVATAEWEPEAHPLATVLARDGIDGDDYERIRSRMERVGVFAVDRDDGGTQVLLHDWMWGNDIRLLRPVMWHRSEYSRGSRPQRYLGSGWYAVTALGNQS